MIKSSESSDDFESAGSFIESVPMDHHYMTFWDMDDTLIVTAKPQNKAIKNPHLLLPILLYQARAPQQAWVICTNRSKDELAYKRTDKSFFMTKDFLEVLRSFGIDMSLPEVIFGTGRTEDSLEQSTYLFEQAIAFLKEIHSDTDTDTDTNIEMLRRSTEQLSLDEPAEGRSTSKTALNFDQALTILKENVQAIRLTDAYKPMHQALEKIMLGVDAIDYLNILKEGILSTRYHGKNYIINKCLTNHFDESSGLVRLGPLQCPPSMLHAGMVDDNPNIGSPAIAQSMGDNYFGVIAARGGNVPKKDSIEDLAKVQDNYYQDNYLIEVARHIGLENFSQGCFRTNFKEKMDPVLGLAAYLYAWHAQGEDHDLDRKPFEVLLEDLDAKQWLQMYALLEYVNGYLKENHPMHPSKHHRDVSPLLSYMDILQVKDKMLELSTAVEEYRALHEVVKAYPKNEHVRSFSLDEDSVAKDSVKDKKHKRGLKSLSLKRKSAKPKAVTATSTIEDFDHKFEALKNRVAELTSDENEQVQRLACVVLATFKSMDSPADHSISIKPAITPLSQTRRTRANARSDVSRVPMLTAKNPPKRSKRKKRSDKK